MSHSHDGHSHDHGSDDHSNHDHSGGGMASKPAGGGAAPGAVSFGAEKKGTDAGEAIAATDLYRTELTTLNRSGVTGSVEVEGLARHAGVQRRPVRADPAMDMGDVDLVRLQPIRLDARGEHAIGHRHFDEAGDAGAVEGGEVGPEQVGRRQRVAAIGAALRGLEGDSAGPGGAAAIGRVVAVRACRMVMCAVPHGAVVVRVKAGVIVAIMRHVASPRIGVIRASYGRAARGGRKYHSRVMKKKWERDNFSLRMRADLWSHHGRHRVTHFDLSYETILKQVC